MLAGAVSGVDEGDAEVLEDFLGGFGAGVAHDVDICVGVEHFSDVGEGFAFCLAGGGAVCDGDDFAIEAHDGALEAGAGAGGGFEEGGDGDFAIEGVVGPDFDFLEDGGEFAEFYDFTEGELACAEDVFPFESVEGGKVYGVVDKEV